MPAPRPRHPSQQNAYSPRHVRAMPAPRPRQRPATPGRNGLWPGGKRLRTHRPASVSSKSIVWDAPGARPQPFLPGSGVRGGRSTETHPSSPGGGPFCIPPFAAGPPPPRPSSPPPPPPPPVAGEVYQAPLHLVSTICRPPPPCGRVGPRATSHNSVELDFLD
eukprot:gene19068-biopygen23460